MKHYSAPWSTSLVLMSVLTTALCLGAAAGFLAVELPAGLCRWLPLLPLALLLGAVPFTIRGYAITPNAILVHRLLWSTQLPLAGLESARVEPDAMRGSIRTFGNGGAFSFTGLYSNERLGSYRAFVTDPRRTVVLRYVTRNVVLSPDASEDFVRELGHRKERLKTGKGCGVNTPVGGTGYLRYLTREMRR